MAQILVRDLDKDVVERLKKRAKKEGRSLQSEVKSILEQAAALDMQAARKLVDAIRKKISKRKMKDSTVLVREDRDR